MNAYELADELLRDNTQLTVKAAYMLRQQADRIAELEKKPQKYCPSENNEAYEKGFIEGMAKQRESSVDKWVNATAPQTKPLSDVEISLIAEEFTGADGLDVVDFGRAIEERHGIK